MDMFAVFVFLAVAAVIVSLGSGILSMVVNHEVAHWDSAHWMAWRVTFQAIAVVLVLLAVQKAA